MLVLFCCDPCVGSAVDSMYESELAAARAAGFDVALVDHEALVADGDAVRAVAAVPRSVGLCRAIYRGWMMAVEAYERFFAALASRGVTLLTTPEAYRHAHHLPASYDVIADFTARSAWVPVGATVDWMAVRRTLQSFGDGPVIVKDYVKSQKHYWTEACFVPRAADVDAAEKVVRRFLQLQGDDLAGGLVFRAYEDFVTLGRHEVSAMPLAVEYRFFVLQGRPNVVCPYWDGGRYEGAPPPAVAFEDVLGRVRSPFFTADVALRRDGEWRIVELGDGQVAGLPVTCEAPDFYAGLACQLGD